MCSGRSLFALSILLLAALVGACGGPTPEEEQAAQQAEDWAWLQQTKSDLDAKRQELKELRERPDDEVPEEETEAAAEPGEAAAEEGAEPPSPEEQATALENAINKLAEEFVGRLIEFINNQGLVEGVELTDIQRQAFDVKADEDILVAQEYIDKGGEYQKAIDIFTTSLLADPTSEKLLAARAEAEELRYMTEERFSQVKKKMSQEEVRELLGIPQRRNIREFEKGVVGWFYPKKEPPHTAAGVYFREEKGQLVVYDPDFNAITAADDG